MHKTCISYSADPRLRNVKKSQKDKNCNYCLFTFSPALLATGLTDLHDFAHSSVNSSKKVDHTFYFGFIVIDTCELLNKGYNFTYKSK